MTVALAFQTQSSLKRAYNALHSSVRILLVEDNDPSSRGGDEHLLSLGLIMTQRRTA